MRISIVDDEAYWRDLIGKEILRYDIDHDMEIDAYQSGEEYLKSEKQYDLSFVDVEMPGMDGFETISKARLKDPDGIYAFLTTHLEMSRKGYLVNAFRYIDKTKLEELQEAIHYARILLGRNQKIDVTVIGGGPHKVVLKNIIYIETEGHYIVIHTRQGSFKCSNKMQDIESLLPPNCFSRCHKAYIVNLDEITHMDNRIVYLSDGSNIDVSRRKIVKFRKDYLNRQYECANK